MPAGADGAAVQADGLLVEVVERRDEQGPAVGGGEEEGPARGRAVGEEEEAVEVGPRLAGQAELAVLEGQGPAAVGDTAG